MKDIIRLGAASLALMKDFIKSSILSTKDKGLFRTVESTCLFIGCPKTGHSLIGSLLDAHPRIIIAHEMGVLKYLLAGFGKNQIYSLLLENSKSSKEMGRKVAEYQYVVPNQGQGSFEQLQVIGDKHGEGLTLRLQARPWLFERLTRIMGQVKFIHVTRNPYDSITSLTLPISRNLNLEAAIDYYFGLCDTIIYYTQKIPKDHLFELRHEDFLSNPSLYLKKLCSYLGVDSPDDYLKDCASIVFTSPHKTRLKRDWSLERIDAVKKRSEKYPFLRGYSY